MRARTRGRFQNAGAQALAAHFHQAEAGDAAHLDTRAVVLERFLHRLLDLADVGAVLHVDEVDDDEARHVAQTKLAGDFLRGFEVGGDGGLLDAVLLGGAARVDVDRDERLGRVDDDIAARTQLHDGVVHRGQLILGAEALEQRHGVGIGLNLARVAGHQELHEVLGRAIAFLTLDDDFLDVAVVDVADGALDQVAVRMDQRRSGRAHRLFAQFIPEAGEVVEVALDLGLGALEPGGAHDAAHRTRQVHFGDDRLQALAVRSRADLAADAAAMARIRHEHAVTAREAEISGEGRALVAALFLDDLHQQDLAAVDHVLDLVATAQRHALGAQFVGFLRAAAAAATLAASTTTAATATVLFLGRFFLGGFEAVLDGAVLDRGDLVLFGGVDFGQAAIRIAFAIVAFAAFLVLVIAFRSAQGGFFLGMGGFFRQQGLAVLLGDLVIVGVDFAEGQETVAIATEIDERRLERRLHAGDFRQVDVALYLLLVDRFEIELFNAISLEYRHPRFFRVARIDEHARCHCVFSVRALPWPDQPGWRVSVR